MERDRAITGKWKWHVNPTFAHLSLPRQSGLVLHPIGPPDPAEEPRPMSKQGGILPRQRDHGLGNGAVLVGQDLGVGHQHCPRIAFLRRCRGRPEPQGLSSAPMHPDGESRRDGQGIGREVPQPSPHRGFRTIKPHSDLPEPQPRHRAQFHSVSDHLRMIGPPGSQHRRQQDMGGTAATTTGPAREVTALHHRYPAPDHTLHPEPPRLQRSTAHRTPQFTAKELRVDSSRIVAYRKQQRDSFRVRTTWCGFETGTGSFVI